MKNNSQCLISLILICFSFIFVHIVSDGEAVPLRTPLREFPLRMEKWTGIDRRFSKDTEEVLGTTDYIDRLYMGESGEQIMFYVGYFKSQKRGELIHSPKHCLPGSGWQMEEGEPLKIPLKSCKNRTIEVNRYIIQKGLEKQVLLYWYHGRGRILTNEYLSKLYLVWDALTRGRTDGSLVEIRVPIRSSEEAALKRGIEFIQLGLPLLSKHLPD
jgi:EpsI family protein